MYCFCMFEKALLWSLEANPIKRIQMCDFHHDVYKLVPVYSLSLIISNCAAPVHYLLRSWHILYLYRTEIET